MTLEMNENIKEFNPGDTVRVHYKISEGDKTRIQPFEGVVLARKGRGIGKTFTVRKLGADGVELERIFPLFSPNLVKLEVVKAGQVRRAKLYYLRGRVGHAALKVETAEESK